MPLCGIPEVYANHNSKIDERSAKTDAAVEASNGLKLPKLRAPRPVNPAPTGLLGAINNRGASRNRKPS